MKSSILTRSYVLKLGFALSLYLKKVGLTQGEEHGISNMLSNATTIWYKQSNLFFQCDLNYKKAGG